MLTKEGRIIDPKYRWIYTTDLQGRVRREIRNAPNKKLIARFIADAGLGKTIRGKAKKKIGRPRQVKYLQDLKKLDRFFAKPLDEVTQEDMERFITALEDGGLSKKNGEPYATETQVAIKKIVIKFYKWLNAGTPSPLTNWIDTSYRIKDHRALSKDEVELLARNMTSTNNELLVRNRTLVLFLFDSGCRIDETLNIRLRNLENRDGTYYVRVEHSKTKPRTIGLPLSTPALQEWLGVYSCRNDPEATLFGTTYKSCYDLLRRAGARLLGMSVTPHMLRKASATYWASHLGRYPLCRRFGWSMSSRQPDRYIDQAGLDEEQVTRTVERTHIAELEGQNRELQERLGIMEEQMRALLGTEIVEVKRLLAQLQGGASE